MSTANIRDVLSEISGSRFVTIVAKTIPKFKGGKGCKYTGRVEKLGEINGIVNFIYENSVNNQRVREGENPDFEVKPRSWGTRIRLKDRLLPFVAKIDKEIVSIDELKKLSLDNLYLEMKVQNSLSTKYLLDGKLTNQKEEDDIKKNLYINPSSGKVQGLEEIVVIRDYAIKNIKELRVNGTIIYA